MARGVILGKAKPGSANTRGTCFVVWMRHAVSGQWERVSTSGFVVVCPSEHELREMLLFLGTSLFQPTRYGLPITISDEQYLDWLKEHWLKPEPYLPRGKDTINPGVDRKAREVSFALWKRGWVPAAEDVLGGPQPTLKKPVDKFQKTYWDL